MNESLYKDNVLKDGEIRKLKNEIEQMLLSSLRNEISVARDLSKNDEAMNLTKAESGDWEPVKDLISAAPHFLFREELASYQQRIQKMEVNLTASGNDVRALRVANVSLRREVSALCEECATLMRLCQSLAMQDQFKDDIIHEMRRQLKRAKAQACPAADADAAHAWPTPTASTSDATPRLADDSRLTPDESVIAVDRSASPPLLLSKESIANMVERNAPAPTPSGTDSSSTHSKSLQIKDQVEVKELFFKGKKEPDNDGSGGVGVGSARVYEFQSASALQIGKSREVKLELKLESTKDARESIGRSSDAESPSGSSASARAQFYHNKLLATQQILQNKEETVEVQAKSLAVAEERIVTLTARSIDLKREIERKAQELQTLRKTVEQSKTERKDVSITAQIQEIDKQENIVSTLQNNLGVIEDLYRECFYETAKQEGLIEMLRNSYLDVRLMDKEKSDQITRLHNVINTQKWSLDKCQNIAADVDNLKVEISNFLNSSKNDSGVWEESVPGCVTEDLHEIAGQLLRLGEILTGDCTCGLQEENTRLRKTNESLEAETNELRKKIADLENILEFKDTADSQHLKEIRNKEYELHSIRQQLAAVEFDTKERECSQCESLKNELQQTHVLLSEKSSELAQTLAQCERHEQTTRRLREELDHANDITKEYSSLRSSTSTAQRRVRALRVQLARALQHCAQRDACHRAEVNSLESALREAQERGAALCTEAQRAARRVREWTRHRQDLHREQEDQIKQKESQIRLLELRILQEAEHNDRNDTSLTRASEKACSKCISNRTTSNSRSRSDEPSCSKYQHEGSSTSVRQRRECRLETSASEMDSEPPPAPVPPLRLSRLKRLFCDNRVCSGCKNASVQRPERSDATTGHSRSHSTDKSRDSSSARHSDTHCYRLHAGHTLVHTKPRSAPMWCASVEETLSRLESAGAALQDSKRRWSKHHALNHT